MSKIDDLICETVKFFNPGSMIINQLLVDTRKDLEKLKSKQILLVFLNDGNFLRWKAEMPEEEIIDWPRLVVNGQYVGSFRQCAAIHPDTGRIWKFINEDEIRLKQF